MTEAEARALVNEQIDAINRLAAMLQRNSTALLWLAAVELWRAEPWWRRGPVPKWPKELR